MSKIAYFDCFSGISGDMVLGALLDVGLPSAQLQDELQKLPLSGYRLEVSKEKRGAILGTRCRVVIQAPQHVHRTFADIKALLQRSALDATNREKSLAIFARLARAEATVHGVPMDHVHFHEVGAMDSLIDVVGSVVAMNLLGVERICASKIPLGSGMVHTQHGLLPVPAPATVLLLQGAPVYDNGQARELVTPTGAAILAALAESFGPVPDMTLGEVGYGVGSHPASDPPNLLRVMVGAAAAGLASRRLIVMETHIDDMSPEFYEYVMERLFALGVLDVGFVPMQMKKNRPGVLVRAILEPHLRQAAVECVLTETTTLGLRLHEVERIEVQREHQEIATPYGPMRVKCVTLPCGDKHAVPEYEDCKSAAAMHRVPLRHIYELVTALAAQQLDIQA